MENAENRLKKSIYPLDGFPFRNPEICPLSVDEEEAEQQSEHVGNGEDQEQAPHPGREGVCILKVNLTKQVNYQYGKLFLMINSIF